MMWHEARKQEKKIRGMIVDYHRRAERRRDYYEKIKADPTQFLQIHGRPCKIHLDPAVAAAGDSPANMMPWQGQADTLIDRFDVRAHLDFIPQSRDDGEDSPNIEERQANYERYRILVQNEFLGVPEEKFLRQLYLEEQFGPVGGQQSKEPPPNPDKKGKKVPGAAIGYVYEDDAPSSGPIAHPILPIALPSAKQEKEEIKNEENAEDEDEDSDVDFDICLDISKIDTKQAHEMNRCGLGYGMSGNDFFSFLTDDFEEQEALKLAREQEEEKAMFAGRKSRRERRAFREKKLVGRKISPPSYATRSSPTYDPYRMSPNSRSKSKSQSRSRSTSPVNAGVIQYITSFGDEEDAATAGLSGGRHVPTSKPILKEPVKRQSKRSLSSSSDRSSSRRLKRRSKSRSRSRSWSRSIPRSQSRGRRRKASSSRSSRSRSRSYSQSLSRSRSRSASRSRKRSSSSSSKGSYRYSKRSRSRDRSQSTRRRRSCSSRSRSPSRSRKRSRSGSFRTSVSPTPIKKKTIPSDQPAQQLQQPVQRYYGRRKGNSSSSDLEASDSEETSAQPLGLGAQSGNTLNKNSRSGSGNSQPADKASNSGFIPNTPKMTPQERLKKKMQALLNRQYKADKKAEKARMEKAEQERNDRKEELRELALKMRRRERQKRHKMRDGDHDSDSETEDHGQWSSGSSDSQSDKSSPTRSRRSRSHSPDQSKATESKHGSKWDVPNRSCNDENKGKEERFRKEENFRRQDSYSYRKEDNYHREDNSNYRRDDDHYYQEQSSYRRDSNHRREETNTFRRDDTHGGPSRTEGYYKRDFGNRRYENDGYRGREDSYNRGGGRGDWNRRDENYGKPRYGSRRRDDNSSNYDSRRNESTRPKLVDY